MADPTEIIDYTVIFGINTFDQASLLDFFLYKS